MFTLDGFTDRERQIHVNFHKLYGGKARRGEFIIAHEKMKYSIDFLTLQEEIRKNALGMQSYIEEFDCMEWNGKFYKLEEVALIEDLIIDDLERKRRDALNKLSLEEKLLLGLVDAMKG